MPDNSPYWPFGRIFVSICRVISNNSEDRLQGGAKVMGQCFQLIVQLLLVQAQFFYQKIYLNLWFNHLHKIFLNY